MCDRCEKQRRAEKEISEAIGVIGSKGVSNDDVFKDIQIMGDCECTVDRGRSFHKALEGRGVLEIDRCDEAFSVECVLKCFLNLISQCTSLSQKRVVALQAVLISDREILSEEGRVLLFVIQDNKCCFLKGSCKSLLAW